MNRRRQPHRIPPPLSHGSESLHAEVVLHDFPDELGIYLWKTVRTVTLWTDLHSDLRRRAFDVDAYSQRVSGIESLDIDPLLADSLLTAATVLHSVDVHVEAVVTACRHIASWAEEQGAIGTALEFTQAAAGLTPDDPEVVQAVAHVARRKGELGRAESWYRQAITVARRNHDWLTMVGSQLGLGTTLLQRGNVPAARQTLVRGVRAAGRHSLRDETALANHQLALAAMRLERTSDAVRYAREAFEGYGSDDRDLAALAVDLGAFWTRTGHFDEAFKLLRGAAPGSLSPGQRLARSAALMRAAAETGDTKGYRAAGKEASLLLEGPSPLENQLVALLDIVHASAIQGDAVRGQEAARLATALADGLDESPLRQEALKMLENPTGKRPRSSQKPKQLSKEARGLTDELVGSTAILIEAR